MTGAAAKLLTLLGKRGPSRFAELRAELGNPSQPTFSRLVRSVPDSVVKFGQRRSGVYYALLRAFDVGSRHPLYSVRPDGGVDRLGEVAAVEPRGFVFVPSRRVAKWLLGERGNGWFDDVPFFLRDMQPQGYIGRLLAQQLRVELDLPERLQDWQAHHVMGFLVRRGEDCPGNLLVGERSYERYMAAMLAGLDKTMGEDDLASSYEHAAERILAGGPPGSSAGGEQPKFAATVGTPAAPRHVLVKFSPKRGPEAAERWADLLVCEHLAHQVVVEHGIAAARSRLIDGATRRFLEVERFDRVGAFGRRAVVSLFVLDAEFSGQLDAWPLAGERLRRRGWLAAAEIETLFFLWSFSGFIANTDRHLGNVTMLPQEDRFVVAPMYDALPMLFAPQGSELVARPYDVPPPSANHVDLWRRAGGAGVQFWQRVAADGRISATFRALATRCATVAAQALGRVR